MRILVVFSAFFLVSLSAIAGHAGSGVAPSRAAAEPGQQKKDFDKVEITGKFKGKTLIFAGKTAFFQTSSTGIVANPPLTGLIPDLRKAGKAEFIRPQLGDCPLGSQSFGAGVGGRDLLVQATGDERCHAFLRSAQNGVTIRFTDVPLLNGGTIRELIVRLDD